MATLTSTKIKNTYDALLKASDNDAIGSSAKQITDGLGNGTPLYISTTQIGIGVTPEATYDLHVYSNAKVGGNLTVTGDLTVEGTTTTIDTQTLTVEDPLIEVASNNTSTDAVDIGWYGKYAPSGTVLYAGLFRDTGDSKFKLFRNLEEQPTTTINTGGTGYTKADLVIGGLEATTGDFTDTVTVDGDIEVENSSGFGRIEIGGSSGGYIDLKSPFSDDFDLRLYTAGTNAEINAISGELDITAYTNINLQNQGTDVLTIESSRVLFSQQAVFGNDIKALFGGSSDLQIYHSATGDSYIANNTGDLIINSSGITGTAIKDEDNMASDSASHLATQQSIKAYVDNSVGNSTLAEVLVNGNTTGGTDIAVSAGDDITFTDTSKALFGTGNDLQIFHESTDSYIKDVGTGNLWIQGSTQVNIGGANGQIGIQYVEGADVTLRHNNAAKLSTTSTGIDVTGRISNLTDPSNAQDAATKNYVDSQVGANNELSEVLANGNTTGGTDISVSSGDDITFADDSKAIFGTDGDLEIYHYSITDTSQITINGKLDIRANTLQLKNYSGETYFRGASNGAVRLYYDGVEKFITTSTGVQVTGSNLSIFQGSGATKLQFAQTDGNWKIEAGGGTNQLVIHSESLGSDYLTIKGGGQVQLNDYGSGSFTGTATYRLAVDSSGDVIEIPIGDGAVDGSGAAGQVAFWTDTDTIDGENNLYWDSTNDRLGIGTDTPLLNLQVNSNTNANSTIAYSENNTLKWYTRHNASDDSFQIVDVPNATTALNIASGGNVGIGTTSPDSKLHVDSGVSSTSDWGNLGIISDFPINNTGRIYTSYLLQDSESIKGAGIGLAYDGTGYKMHFGTASTTSSGLSTQMTIDRLGNLGIGMTSPAEKLDVNGSINLRGGQIYAAADGSNTFFANAVQHIFRAGSSGSYAERMRIDSSGNITASVDSDLTYEFGKAHIGYVGHADHAGFSHIDVNAAGSYALLQSNDGETYLNAASGQNIRFRNNNSDLAIIDSSGNIAIGTTDPDGKKLRIVHSTGQGLSLSLNSGSGTNVVQFGDTSDSDIGQISYDHTNNFMAFQTNNAERMRIDSSGKITSTGASEGVVKVVGSSASHRAEVMVEGAGQFTASFVAIAGSAPAYGGIPASTAGITTSSTDLVFATNSTERMRIDTSGNVGIGVTSGIDANLRVDANSATLTQEILKVKGGGSSGNYGFLVESNNGDDLFKVDTLTYNSFFPNGNVGISTTSPTNGKLEVQQTATTAALWVQTGGTTDSYTIADFRTGTNASALAIKGNGNVEIGTGRVDIGTRSYVGSATSTTRLYLEGNTNGHNLGQFQMADLSGGFMFYLSGSSPTSRQSHQFYNNRIDSSPTLVGSIQINSSSTAFNTSSDYRLKENVVEMTGALDRVEQLKPSRFNFIGHEEIVDGFLAHEVSDIVPEAITGTKDEVDSEGNPVYQGIDQSKLVPLLVGAIQELKAEIETLKAQINN